ncbi:MAG: M24 family metallopeptidase [Acidobacteriota bacterium]
MTFRDYRFRQVAWWPLFLWWLGWTGGVILAGSDTPASILPLRERARLQDDWLSRRLDRLIPELMRRERIDLWILAAREYNEDAVLSTMLPSTWFSARRRTIVVFHDRGPEKGVERLAVARYSVGSWFETVWQGGDEERQWERLAEIVAERNPRRIGINRSRWFAPADGLSSSEYEALMASLPEALRGRVVSAERLAVGWLERRIPEEMEVYPSLCRIAHQIIAEGLSPRAVKPGVTSTDDLAWWFRERIEELDLDTWFHPSVSVQRIGQSRDADFSTTLGRATIQPGDLIHVDFGITYLGLNTDTQQHAYVLRPGQTAAPAGLRHGLAVGNRMQDLLMGEFRAGRTGNEILALSLDRARREGIKASIYSHPLGYHGHAAGPLIGLWDAQDGVPGLGDYPLFADTVFSIELNVEVEVPEWNTTVRIMLEEDAFFDGRQATFLDGRQTEFHLIPSPSPGTNP